MFDSVKREFLFALIVLAFALSISGRELVIHGGVPGEATSIESLDPNEERAVCSFRAEHGAPDTEFLATLAATRRAFGLVTDVVGEPIASAQVDCLPKRRPRTEVEAAASVATSTARDGCFFLTGLPTGSCELRATAPGFAPLRVPGVLIPSLESGVSEALDLGTLVLAPDATVVVRVHDPSGEPLAGVAVHRIEEADSTSLINELINEIIAGQPPYTMSDAKGELFIEGLVPGVPVHLFLTRDGFVPEILVAVRPPQEAPLEAVLRRTGRVLGQVIDEDGLPIEGAEIRTFGNGGRHTSSVRTETDAGGFFELSGLPPGPLGLAVSAPGFRPFSRADLELGEEGGELDDLTVTLQLGARIEGIVRDSEGFSVLGAVVSVFDPQAGSVGQARTVSTDEVGHYTLTGLSPGQRTVTASHADFPPVRRNIELSGDQGDVDLRFPEGYEVVGRVFDPEGTPGIGIQVRVQQLEGTRIGKASVATTNLAGQFVLGPLAVGRYRVSAEPRTGVRASQIVEVTARERVEIELRLTQGATLRGVVSGLGLEELASVRITASGPREPLSARARWDGSYQVEHLAAGEWVVRASIDGRLARGVVRVEPEAAVQGAEIVLDLAFGAGKVLTGTVRRLGEPLVGAWISLAAQGTWLRTLVAEDGSFRLEGLAEGVYDLAVRDFTSGLRHSQQLVLEGDVDLALDLMPTELRGTVYDQATGAAVVGAKVTLLRLTTSGEKPVLFQHSDAMGHVRFGSVSGGQWKLMAQVPGEQPAETNTIQANGQPLEELQLELRSQGTEVGAKN